MRWRRCTSAIARCFRMSQSRSPRAARLHAAPDNPRCDPGHPGHPGPAGSPRAGDHRSARGCARSPLFRGGLAFRRPRPSPLWGLGLRRETSDPWGSIRERAVCPVRGRTEGARRPGSRGIIRRGEVFRRSGASRMGALPDSGQSDVRLTPPPVSDTPCTSAADPLHSGLARLQILEGNDREEDQVSLRVPARHRRSSGRHGRLQFE